MSYVVVHIYLHSWRDIDSKQELTKKVIFSIGHFVLNNKDIDIFLKKSLSWLNNKKGKVHLKISYANVKKSASQSNCLYF